MTRKIQIAAGKVTQTAVLDDSPTADAIWNALPIEGHANLWGDEIYFNIPVHLEETEDARQEMDVGELGYWPVGTTFCIFFGPTPASVGEKPRAYSNVNPFGQIEGDATAFRTVTNGEMVTVSRTEG
ncbi:MAG TPA: hypothetical protein G4O11_10815 [Anaerolineae bacterium]|nr:hypothetical protein [Anaerolineae bacterium]